jgi:shikimate dehydrogenase
VNTIHIKEGKFYGYNTDAHGFLNSLIEAGRHPKGLRVVVLGAGGAARAVVFALARAEAGPITVLNRTAARAAFLVEDLAEAFPGIQLNFAPLTGENLAALKDNVDLVINTTSVGMHPHIQNNPWPGDVPMPGQVSYCDLVYNPLETLFLRTARLAGATTIDGLGMLVHQGAYAFEMWTGYAAPLAVMRRACMGGLKLDEQASD